MTQQDDIIQPVLTDDEILALEIASGGTFSQAPVPFARAIESAVLSKLRAPVAGEAQPVAWKIYDAALGKHILTENPKVADMLLREGGSSVRPLVYGGAAPQASAEYERGHADGWAAGWDQAIKQPHADKDGGQQRAGDGKEPQ